MHTIVFHLLTAPARWVAGSVRSPARLGVWLVTAALAGCASAPTPRPAQAPQAPEEPPPSALPAPTTPAPVVAEPEPAFTGPVSLAASEREYRRDGARHLYGRYAERIYPGKLPPLLQAVGVMRLHIGARGELQRLEWMRAPDHVPHVRAEIERLVQAAVPFPAPRRLGSVVYTETWLWDRSGRFQLDTLSEGQLDRSAPVRPATAQPVTAPKRSRTTAATPSKPAPVRVAQDSASP